jgi:FkbM family methyltransferase
VKRRRNYFKFEEFKKIYDSLSDNFSKKIFLAKFESNLMQSIAPLVKLMLTPEFKSFRSELSSTAKDISVSSVLDYLENKRVNSERLSKVVFFVTDLNYLLQANLMGFDDLIKPMFIVLKGDLQPSEFNSKYKIIKEKEFLDNYNNEDIMLLSSDFQDLQENKSRLIKNGINVNKIFLFTDYFSQYFPKKIIIPKEREIFLDCGVLDMGSSIDFIRWCNGKYDFIYAFEPDPNSYKICENILKVNDILDSTRIKLINKGVFDRAAQLKFNSRLDALGSSSIDTIDGSTKINTVSIDEFLDGKLVTFIKMDIEGSELAALVGAKNTIKKYKPRLAICIYHKPSDIIDIPLYILSLVPEYKLYIRHYSSVCNETVLYCVCE